MKHSGSVYIPAAETVAGIERTHSRFIAYLFPAETREDIENRLTSLRVQYKDATHVVYAFRVGGLNREILGMSDDGEPKGTAGAPVLKVLCGRGVTNAGLVVVRYFGGTKLGTGGLVRAYGDSARTVLDEAVLVPLVLRRSLHCVLPYALLLQLQRLTEEADGEVDRIVYDTDVECEITVPEARADWLIAELTDISAGGILIEE